MLEITIEQPLCEFSLMINTTISPQGVTAILGRSGAGKSSLINLIAGLTPKATGKILLNGRTLFNSKEKINLPPEKRRIGYVFQEPRLFPHYSVEKNLKYGCKRFDPIKFLQLIELLGIQHLLDRFPNHLSGGEKQRVAIGRALLTEPDILLFDEPLSALDLPRKAELLEYLRQLTLHLEIPILYVTHHLDEVIQLADSLMILEKGKLLAHGSTTQIWHSDLFSAWQPHTQKISLLELPISKQLTNYQMLGLLLASEPTPQYLWIHQQPRYQSKDNIRITLASRDISLTLNKPEKTSIRNILHGIIHKIEPKSDRVDIAVNVSGHQIWATISQWAFTELDLTFGQNVYLQIKSISV